MKRGEKDDESLRKSPTMIFLEGKSPNEGRKGEGQLFISL